MFKESEKITFHYNIHIECLEFADWVSVFLTKEISHDIKIKNFGGAILIMIIMIWIYEIQMDSWKWTGFTIHEIKRENLTCSVTSLSHQTAV